MSPVAPETQAYLDGLPDDERAKIPAAVVDPTSVSSHTEPDPYVQALMDDDTMEKREYLDQVNPGADESDDSDEVEEVESEVVVDDDNEE